jgi:hypothetical protein
MAECVDQRLVTDAVNFIAYDRVQRLWVAFDNDSESYLILNCEFLLDTGKSLFEIKRAMTVRRAQPTDCVPAFFNDLSHQFQHAADMRLRQRVSR